MRRILISDLLAWADLLLSVPDVARAGVARRLLLEAHAAHKYHRRKGRPHPAWGDGSLMSRCRKFGIAQVPMTAEEFIPAVCHLLDAPWRPVLKAKAHRGP